MSQKSWNRLKTNLTAIREIVEKFAPSQVKDFDTALKNKDRRKMLRLLNDAWWNAPDRPEIHSIPGWDILCDLCSDNMQ